MSSLIELAVKVENYNPEQSPDNRADELEIHRDIVLATGVGSMNPPFEQTFVRSLDAAMTLVDDQLVTVILRDAIDRLDQCFNPLDNYLVKLRLFVAAAALRARAASTEGEG